MGHQGRRFHPCGHDQRQHRPQRDQQNHHRRPHPCRPGEHQCRNGDTAPQLPGIPGAAAFVHRHQGFGVEVQDRQPGGQQRRMQVPFRCQCHQHRAERLFQHGPEPGEIVGPAGGHHGCSPDQPPGQHRFAQADLNPQPVDQPGVGARPGRVDHLGAPLLRQRRHQVGFADPVMRQQNIAQPRLFARLHRQRLDQVARVNSTIFHQNLAQRPPHRGADPVQPGKAARLGCRVRRDDAQMGCWCGHGHQWQQRLTNGGCARVNGGLKRG